MAGATLSTLSNIMKNFYLGPVQSQFNNEILVNQLLGVSSENLVGLQAVLPLHSARTGSVGSRGELETLPAAGNQGYSQAVYDLAYHYGRAQVSGQAIHKTSSSAGAFLQAMKSELDGLRDDLALGFARQIYGAGDGVVATTAVNTGVTVLNLQSSEAIIKGFLYINQVIDLGTLANPQVNAAARTITDVDPAANGGNGTITISGANVTTAAGDKIFVQGNAGPSTTYALREMPAGLLKIVSTAANTVGGINAASAGTKFWDNLRDTTGGAISLSSLMQNWNKAYMAGAKQGNVVAITTPGIVRRLFETSDFKALIQFVNTNEFKGGFSEVSFAANGTPIKLYPDRHAPYGNVLILDKGHVRMFSPMDWSFLDKDGLTVRWVPDTDAYQTALFRYASLGVDRRNTSVLISGLTDTGF
jgi:hypothetical protein